MRDVREWLRAEWDRVAGYGLIGLGALMLLLGFQGVSGSPFVAEELAYIASGGIGGLFLLGVGVTLLLRAELHDQWRTLDRIEKAIDEATAVEREALAAAADKPARSSNGRPRRRVPLTR